MLYQIDCLFWTAVLTIQGFIVCLGTLSDKATWMFLQQQDIVISLIPTFIAGVLHTGSLIYRYVCINGSRLRIRYIVYEIAFLGALLFFAIGATAWMQFKYCLAPLIACTAFIFLVETGIAVFSAKGTPVRFQLSGRHDVVLFCDEDDDIMD